MFTVGAYSQSHASTSILIATAITDPHLTVTNSRIVVPDQLSQIVGAYAQGPDIARGRLQSPSLLALLMPELSPVDTGATPGSPDRFIDYRFTPMQLAPQEQLEFDFANAAAGANIGRGVVWLADGPITPVSGDVRSVRVTGTTTAVAETWTNVALTFDQALPAGRYQVVGARMFGASMIAFRFVFPGYPWRPGGIGTSSATLVEPPEQRFGNLGVWGDFAHNAPPTMDILCTAGDTAQTGVIDLIKIA